MGLIYFRPYKRISNSRLMYLIDVMTKKMQENDSHLESEAMNFNQLIREAKTRKLSLSPVELYSKILYSSHMN